LRDDRQRFLQAGGEVVLIGLGRPEQADLFCRRRAGGLTCFTSPDGSAHQVFGLRRGTASQVAGPKVWGSWVRKALRGHVQGRFGQGDPARLPGTFVVDTAGVVRFAHRGRRSDDNPPNDDVLAAVASAVGDPG
jgi:AhpC/TSA antioxidant enzyme